MTPGYASPEQIQGGPVTTQSDVYSLGVLLTELLTGRKPNSSEKPAKGNGEPAMQMEPLGPDLDAMTQQATAEEPGRRYASVAELSADVTRYLEKRPVLARPPSLFYSIARMCARNKAVTGVTALLVLAVLAGLTAVGWQTRVAQRERLLAERRFENARKLIYTVIHEIQPQLADVNGATAIRKSLVEKTLVYLEALWKDAAANPDLTRELVDSYVTLASIAGDPSTSNTGDSHRAADILAKAEPLAGTLYRQKAMDANTCVTLALFYGALARNQNYFGSVQTAQDYAKRAVAAADRLNLLEPGEKRSLVTLAASLMTLAGFKPHGPDAVPLFERALASYQTLAAQDPSDTNRQRVALAYKNLASLWLDLEDFQRSLDAARQARAWDEKRLAEDPSSPEKQMAIAFDLGAIGAAQESLNRLPEAAETMRENVALRERIAAANRDNRRAADRLAYATRDLASVERQLGKRAASRRHLERTLELYEALSARGPLVPQSLDRFASATASLAEMQFEDGMKNRGCALFRKAVTLMDELDRRGSAFSVPMQAAAARTRVKSCAAEAIASGAQAH
jgi:tetratricopeptide (TPR) repeat protein